MGVAWAFNCGSTPSAWLIGVSKQSAPTNRYIVKRYGTHGFGYVAMRGKSTWLAVADSDCNWLYKVVSGGRLVPKQPSAHYAAPTATPVPTSPPDQPSSGQVIFGQGLHDGLHIWDRQSTLTVGNQRFAYIAQFSQVPSALQVKMVYAKNGAGGTQTNVYDQTLNLTSPQDNLIGNAVPWDAMTGLGITAPGSYTLAFYQTDGSLLAKGNFTLQ